MRRPPPPSTLFPYTPLFRSVRRLVGELSGIRFGNQARLAPPRRDRESTRLNSSHITISYAVLGLKKKKHPARCGRLAPTAHPSHVRQPSPDALLHPPAVRPD